MGAALPPARLLACLPACRNLFRDDQPSAGNLELSLPLREPLRADSLCCAQVQGSAGEASDSDSPNKLVLSRTGAHKDLRSHVTNGAIERSPIQKSKHFTFHRDVNM